MTGGLFAFRCLSSFLKRHLQSAILDGPPVLLVVGLEDWPSDYLILSDDNWVFGLSGLASARRYHVLSLLVLV